MIYYMVFLRRGDRWPSPACQAGIQMLIDPDHSPATIPSTIISSARMHIRESTMVLMAFGLSRARSRSHRAGSSIWLSDGFRSFRSFR